MVNYVRLAAKTKTIVEATGRSLTFIRKSRQDADSAKPWRAPKTASFTTPADDRESLSIVGAVTDYDENDTDGLIRRGDKKVIIAHDSVDPDTIEAMDAYDDGGVRYKILHVTILKPGDTRLCYIVHSRR